jgi:hypothetical protein
MKKTTVTVDFATLIALAMDDEFAPVTDKTRRIVCQLCGVDTIDDTNIPRAIMLVRKHLFNQFSWLDSVSNLVMGWYLSVCGTCDVNHHDKDDFEARCKIRHQYKGLVALFGDTHEVEKLPDGAYIEDDDPLANGLMNLLWFQNYMGAMGETNIFTDGVNDFDISWIDDDDPIKWN